MRTELEERAIRFADLINDSFLKEKISNTLEYHNTILAGLNSKPLTVVNIMDEINVYKKKF